MTHAAAPSTCREMDVSSASPERLGTNVYDFLLVNLRRAGIAIDTNNVELVSASVGTSQEVLAELMGAPDMEQGVQIARELGAPYAFFIGSLIGIARRKDRRRLSRITAEVTELRDASAQVSTTRAANAA